MAEKIYVPKCKAQERDGQFGPFIKLGFNADALIEFARQHKNARGYLNLVLTRRRNPEPDGATHSVYLDTYEPGDRKPFERARQAVNNAPKQSQFADVPPPPELEDKTDVPF